MFTGYFIATLTCQWCAKSNELYIQTSLPIETNGQYSEHRVGDPIDTTSPESAGYLKLRDIRKGEPLRLLELWDCPACGRANWAEVEIDQERVQAIRGVPWNQPALDHAQYLTEYMHLYFDMHTWKSFFVEETPRPNFMALLQQALEESPKPPTRIE
jgi:hypothetical protein